MLHNAKIVGKTGEKQLKGSKKLNCQLKVVKTSYKETKLVRKIVLKWKEWVKEEEKWPNGL